MKYFDNAQFKLVAQWLLNYMKYEKTLTIDVDGKAVEMQLTEARAESLQGDLDQNPRGLNLPAYALHVNSLIQQHSPVTSEKAFKFYETLYQLLQTEAEKKENDIDLYKNTNDANEFNEFMKDRYSCILLSIEHDPLGVLEEANRVARINPAHFPIKTTILIRPNTQTVSIFQQGKPASHLKAEPETRTLASSTKNNI